MGSLFEYVDRHYNHSNHSYPLAHNLVTSHYLSGAVRFPVDLEIYRRYEEVTRWSEFVHKYFPELEIPKQKYAIQKHWCLVFVAYSLLHLACLPTSLIPSKGKILSHPIKTIGEVCRQQGQRLIEELILLAHKQLQGGQSASEVFSRLFAKQRKEVPA